MHTFPSMTPLNQGSKPILSVKIYRQFFNKLGLKILIFKIDVIALHSFVMFFLCYALVNFIIVYNVNVFDVFFK